MDEARLDEILGPDWPGDVRTLAMDELRAKRSQAQECEVALSYQRRMAQGRLDIVAAEQRRRTTGEPPVDHDHLVEQLSGVLADRGRPAGNGRLPQLMAPDTASIDTDELDAIAGPAALGSLPDIDDVGLATLVERLSTYEHEVSARRRSLHLRIDALQAEITRRYREGEASVESLLR